ncbi:RNA polymerase-binding protein DksA, partial [Liberibacter sp. Z1]|nr:RNA polymerase-binding protein DksA [Candidatus Liberibacter sp.]
MIDDRENNDNLFSEEGEFMTDSHLAYFSSKLIAWKKDLLQESCEALLSLSRDNSSHADEADRASSSV